MRNTTLIVGLLFLLLCAVACSDPADDTTQDDAGTLSEGMGGAREDLHDADQPTGSSGGAGSTDTTDAEVGGMGGDYWGPEICKWINEPYVRQCTRFPADSEAYD